jgi:hypothetical protein
LGSFLRIKEVAQNFGLIFHRKRTVLILTKNGQQIQLTFWVIGSQNHQGTMLVKVLMIITDEEQILGLLISEKNYVLILTKNDLGYILGDFFPENVGTCECVHFVKGFGLHFGCFSQIILSHCLGKVFETCRSIPIFGDPSRIFFTNKFGLHFGCFLHEIIRSPCLCVRA